MNIEQSQTRLVLQQRPMRAWIVGVICALGLTYLLVCIGFVLPIHSTLICQRATQVRVDCQLQESSLFKSHLIQMPLDNLRQAKVKWLGQDNAILLTTYKKLALLPVPANTVQFPTNTLLIKTSRKQAQQFASQIDAFLEDTYKGSSLSLKQGFRWLALPAIGLLSLVLLFGFLQALLIPSETRIFDKTLNLVKLIQKPLLGQAKVKEEQLSLVSDLQFVKPQTSKDKGFAIALYKQDDTYQLIQLQQRQEAENLLVKLRDFLDLHQEDFH